MAPARKKSTEKPQKNISSKAKGKGSTSKRNEGTGSTPLKDIPLNVVKQFDLLQRNGMRGSYIHRSGENIISQRLNNFKVSKIINVFDGRVTCVSWHPTKSFFIVGVKTGSMTLFNYTSEGDTFSEKFQWPGPGPGLSILSTHFPRHMDNKFLTTSIDGTVKLWDFENTSQKPVKTLMSTGTLQRWFCSVNSCTENNVILVGDTKGNLITVDKNLKIVSTSSIHKNKVNSVDFSKRGGWTFATASTDKTVKLFDLRNLKKEMEKFEHERAVNSAYFSNTSSGRLLTTDQGCELRVYKGPIWEAERTIIHPHRHYQHLTPIKATWHPLADLIVVGRYPEDDKSKEHQPALRTVDVFSAETGCLKNELYSANCSGILSLNHFSPCGDFLASAMGLYVPLWRATFSSLKHKLPSDADANGNAGEDNDDGDDDDSGPPKKKKPRKTGNTKNVKEGKMKS